MVVWSRVYDTVYARDRNVLTSRLVGAQEQPGCRAGSEVLYLRSQQSMVSSTQIISRCRRAKWRQ